MRQVLLFLAVTSGCSLANREGPEVTCADLMNGKVNDCADGIIATCANNEVTWTVCSSESTCESQWQTKGAYRCTQSDSLPSQGGGESTGDHTDGTDPGTDDSGVATGGSADDGVDGQPETCGDNEICEIAKLSASTTFCGMTGDAQNLYLVSTDGSAWSVAKAGGPLTRLFTGAEQGYDCATGVDATHVYFANGHSARRVPTGGGDVEVVDARVTHALAVDRSYVFTGSSVTPFARISKDSGAMDTFSNAQFTSGLLAQDTGSLYWLSEFGDVVRTLAKDAATSDSPSSISLGGARASNLVADEVAVYFCDQTSGVIGSVNPGSGAVTTLKVTESPQVLGLGVDNIYWSDGQTLNRMARDGKGTSQIAPKGASHIVADDGHVFFVDRNGSAVFRGPK